MVKDVSWAPSHPRRAVPLDGELESHPRRPSTDKHAEGELQGGVALEERPRPPHERHEEEGRQAPGPEDEDQAYSRPGDASGVEREVRQRREEGEEHGGEGVGEESGPHARGGAPERGPTGRPNPQRST